MRRHRSWTAPADFAVVAGDASLVPTALARVERALDGFPADSPGCIGYATQDGRPPLFCGVQDQKSGAAVRLHGILDNGRFDTWTDDTVVAVRGVRGDRYAGLVARDVASSTLRLCLDAAAAHLRAAHDRPATREQVDVLARRARAVAAMGCGRGHDAQPRFRGNLSTPWGSAACIPMFLSSGGDQAAHNLLDRGERADQDDLTAVLVTLRERRIDIAKDLHKPRDRLVLDVSITAFWSEIADPARVGAMDLMRLAQWTNAKPPEA